MLHAQRHIGLVAQVKENATRAVVAPVVKRHEEALLVGGGSIGGRGPAEVIDTLRRGDEDVQSEGTSILAHLFEEHFGRVAVRSGENAGRSGGSAAAGSRHGLGMTVQEGGEKGVPAATVIFGQKFERRLRLAEREYGCARTLLQGHAARRRGRQKLGEQVPASTLFALHTWQWDRDWKSCSRYSFECPPQKQSCPHPRLHMLRCSALPPRSKRALVSGIHQVLFPPLHQLLKFALKLFSKPKPKPILV